MTSLALININLIADYIIIKSAEFEEDLSVLKLHKLLYYVQSWYLALYGKPLFDEKFQAWVHGPVSRTIYDRFRASKSSYSAVTEEDVSTDLDTLNEALTEAVKEHIDNVLESYGAFSGTQLEHLSHQEEPWLNARKGLNPLTRSEREISEDDMKKYYHKLLISSWECNQFRIKIGLCLLKIILKDTTKFLNLVWLAQRFLALLSQEKEFQYHLSRLKMSCGVLVFHTGDKLIILV